MTSIAPLPLDSLPRVSARAAASGRLPWTWVGRTDDVGVIDNLVGAGALRLGFAGFASAEVRSSESFQLRASDGGAAPIAVGRIAEGRIAIDRWLALNVVAATLGFPAPLALRRLGPTERGVLAAHVAALLARWGNGIAVELDEPPPAAPDASLLGIALRAEAAGTAGVVRVDLPPDWLARWRPAETASAGFRVAAARLPVVACVELAVTTLRRDEIDGAVAGDAVVFDGGAAPAASDWPVQVRIGDHEAAALASPGGAVVLTDAFRRGPGAASKRVTATAHPAGAQVVVSKAGAMGSEADEDDARAAVLAAAPIEVVAELGRTILRGDEVLGLAKGSVLSFAGRSTEVDLIVGGRPWARGELVNVDGELGVRITELVRS